MNVTAVFMTHAEGKLILPSLKSFEAGISFAEAHGITVERIVTLDNPSKDTLKYLSDIDPQKYQKIELSYGDLGKVRNHAANIAKGKYFAILDGDDLWTENWLKVAFEISENRIDETVIHPELNWLFEESNNIFYHVPEKADLFSLDALRSTNPWDSLCFCKTELVRNMPYVKREIKAGFAYEDWNWNRRVIEAGIEHVVAPKTIIFKRRRSASQGAKAAARGVISKPTLSSYYDYYS